MPTDATTAGRCAACGPRRRCCSRSATRSSWVRGGARWSMSAHRARTPGGSGAVDPVASPWAVAVAPTGPAGDPDGFGTAPSARRTSGASRRQATQHHHGRAAASDRPERRALVRGGGTAEASCGHHAYMAPEQVDPAAHGPVGAGADVLGPGCHAVRGRCRAHGPWPPTIPIHNCAAVRHRCRKMSRANCPRSSFSGTPGPDPRPPTCLTRSNRS